MTELKMHVRRIGELSGEDMESLANLINSAYRGVDGSGRWTTENHLVEGHRIDKDGLNSLVDDAGTDFIVGYIGGRIVACIAIKRFDDVVEFGTFAVDPDLHANGYGGALLRYAESLVSKNTDLFQVSVVSKNTDLIAFYERRGYVGDGKKINYPTHLNVGKPKIDDLDLTIMQKNVKFSKRK